MHEVENFCQFVGKKIQLLRNYGWVVELLCFSGLYRVFFYSAVADLRVGKPLLAQLLLPCIEKDAVEGGAKAYIKDVYANGSGCTGGYAGNRGSRTELMGSRTALQSLFKQVFQSASDVYVGGLCKGSVAGVVCFVEACELQCVASICACGQCVFHFSKDCNAKLGIIIQICYICELLAQCAFVPDIVRIKNR